MTAIALTTDTAAVPAAIQPMTGTLAGDAMARLAEWVQLGDQAHALVTRLASSAFIPAAYRTAGDGSIVANATAAVLYGLSLGWDPLTSLQQVYIVHGRPGLYAKAKVALLQARGYEVATLELDPTKATVAVRRPGAADYDKPVTVTMQDAETAGWTSNAAYKKTPADMLWARAAGRACDRSGAAVLLGIATVEDIDDADPVKVTATVERPKPSSLAAIVGQTTAPQEQATAPTPQPQDGPAETPSDRQPDPDDEPAQQLISGPQSRKLHALLGRLGYGERDAGLDYINKVLLEHDPKAIRLVSSKFLTRVSANRVIAALEDLEAANAEAAAEIDAEREGGA